CAGESSLGLRLHPAKLAKQFCRHGETVARRSHLVKLGANLRARETTRGPQSATPGTMSAIMRRLWRRVLDQVSAYATGTSLEEELRGGVLVRLSANESPLGPSPKAIEALRREAPRAHLYPDGGSTELRACLARQLGVSPDSIVVGNGADELLCLLA